MIIETLLNAGADPNVTDNEGHTALLYSVLHACPNIVKLLVDYKADPNIHPNDYSPLRLLAQEEDHEIVSYLLDAGANPNVLDYKGDTPLIIACHNGNKSVVLKLLQHKANHTQ